ncbi:MAG: CCA tRNA nucleotidyltransferase [Candidatus Stygibacter australis]|nr:CCA tRNA nucleotidyltransferase [Candidatus Stygibacter australis]
MKSVIQKIKRAIRNTEFDGNTYIAGGYVRDLVLKNKKSDLDIAVSLPQGGIKLAEFLHENNIASKPVLFDQFGTALAMIGKHKIEFVMTRKESYRKGNRKSSTSPGTLKEDIYRRDFTINSMIMNIMTDEILDLTGKGKIDLQNRVIRATSDPEFIFHDDPLRILRAVRFANRLGFKIESVTAEAMKKDSFELVSISWERKRDEFIKILLSDTPKRGLELVYEFDLMKYIIPELEEKSQDIYLNEISCLPAKQELRMSALLQVLAELPDRDDTIDTIIERLRLSNKLKAEVKLLVHYCHYFSSDIYSDDDLAIRKLIFNYPATIEDFITYYTSFEDTENWQNQPDKLGNKINVIQNELKNRTFPLNGNIIKQELGLPECEKIGCLMEEALSAWLLNPNLDKEELIHILKKD